MMTSRKRSRKPSSVSDGGRKSKRPKLEISYDESSSDDDDVKLKTRKRKSSSKKQTAVQIDIKETCKGKINSYYIRIVKHINFAK